MTDEKPELSQTGFDFEALVALFERTHTFFQNRTIQSVNRNLVVRNWLFGGYLVEFEQGGADRAKYGTALIEELASELKKRRFRGGSVSNLKQIRAFYLSNREIGQSLPGLLAIENVKSQSPIGLLDIVASNVQNTDEIDRLTAAAGKGHRPVGSQSKN